MSIKTCALPELLAALESSGEDDSFDLLNHPQFKSTASSLCRIRNAWRKLQQTSDGACDAIVRDLVGLRSKQSFTVEEALNRPDLFLTFIDRPSARSSLRLAAQVTTEDFFTEVIIYPHSPLNGACLAVRAFVRKTTDGYAVRWMPVIRDVYELRRYPIQLTWNIDAQHQPWSSDLFDEAIRQVRKSGWRAEEPDGLLLPARVERKVVALLIWPEHSRAECKITALDSSFARLGVTIHGTNIPSLLRGMGIKAVEPVIAREADFAPTGTRVRRAASKSRPATRPRPKARIRGKRR